MILSVIMLYGVPPPTVSCRSARLFGIAFLRCGFNGASLRAAMKAAGPFKLSALVDASKNCSMLATGLRNQVCVSHLETEELGRNKQHGYE